jgi:hypothetical protein
MFDWQYSHDIENSLRFVENYFVHNQFAVYTIKIGARYFQAAFNSTGPSSG